MQVFGDAGVLLEVGVDGQDGTGGEDSFLKVELFMSVDQGVVEVFQGFLFLDYGMRVVSAQADRVPYSI